MGSWAFGAAIPRALRHYEARLIHFWARIDVFHAIGLGRAMTRNVGQTLYERRVACCSAWMKPRKILEALVNHLHENKNVRSASRDVQPTLFLVNASRILLERAIEFTAETMITLSRSGHDRLCRSSDAQASRTRNKSLSARGPTIMASKHPSPRR